MISISELLNPRCMVMDLKAKKKKKAIAELAEMFTREGIVQSTVPLLKQLMKREKMTSTGIGHGIAIPHVLSDLTDQTVIGFGRSSAGIPYDAADNKPVHFIFLITGPAEATAEHLKILSKLSRLLTDKAFRETLMEVKTPEEVVDIFRKGEEEK